MKGLQEHSSYICVHCTQLFRSYRKAIQHVIRIHGQIHLPETNLKHYCKLCQKTISKLDVKLLTHFKQKHSNLLQKCRFCSKKFLLKRDLTKHKLQKHSSNLFSSSKFEVIQGFSPNDTVQQRSIFFPPYTEKSIIGAIKFTQRSKILRECIDFVLPQGKNVQYGKFMLCAHAFFIKYSEDGNIRDQQVIPMSTGHRIITVSDVENSDDFFDWIAYKIEDCKDKLEMTNSGWSFQYLSAIDLEFIKFSSIGGCLKEKPEDYKILSILGKNKSENLDPRIKNWIEKLILDFSEENDHTCFFTCISAALCKRQGLLKGSKTLAQQKLIINTFKTQNLSDIMKKKKFACPFPVKKIKSLEMDEIISHLNLSINVWTFI